MASLNNICDVLEEAQKRLAIQKQHAESFILALQKLATPEIQEPMEMLEKTTVYAASARDVKPVLLFEGKQKNWEECPRATALEKLLGVTFAQGASAILGYGIIDNGQACSSYVKSYHCPWGDGYLVCYGDAPDD